MFSSPLRYDLPTLGEERETVNFLTTPVELNNPEKSETVIRILIADGHPILRDGLRDLFGREKDFEVIGEAGNGVTALGRVRDLDPDILLLGFRMPEMDGLSVLRSLQETNSRTKAIILTASEDRNEFVLAMTLGCRGILMKQIAPHLIIKCIRRVNAGEIWLDTNSTAAVMQRFAILLTPGLPKVRYAKTDARLTQRERDVVQLVVQGFKNKGIGEQLFISPQTVKNHLHNIFVKIEVSDRLELALYAIHTGLYKVESVGEPLWKAARPQATAQKEESSQPWPGGIGEDSFPDA